MSIEDNRQKLTDAVASFGRLLGHLPFPENRFAASICLAMAGAVEAKLIEDLSSHVHEWVNRKLAVLETRAAAETAFGG